jgi:hypothetical protein
VRRGWSLLPKFHSVGYRFISTFKFFASRRDLGTLEVRHGYISRDKSCSSAALQLCILSNSGVHPTAYPPWPYPPSILARYHPTVIRDSQWLTRPTPRCPVHPQQGPTHANLKLDRHPSAGSLSFVSVWVAQSPPSPLVVWPLVDPFNCQLRPRTTSRTIPPPITARVPLPHPGACIAFLPLMPPGAHVFWIDSFCFSHVFCLTLMIPGHSSFFFLYL